MSCTLKERVKELIAHHGSLRAAARVLGVNAGYLHRLGTGEKNDPGELLLRRMGLFRLVAYYRIPGALGASGPEPTAPARVTGGDPQNPPEALSCCGGRDDCDVREYCAARLLPRPAFFHYPPDGQLWRPNTLTGLPKGAAGLYTAEQVSELLAGVVRDALERGQQQ